MPKASESPPREAEPRFIRFESADNGDGLFATASWFLDLVAMREIRALRKTIREIEGLYNWLGTNTPAPPPIAYRDDRNRRPVTWFKSTAIEHCRRADRLCELLNRESVNVRRIARSKIPRILWSDDVQVVSRRDREPPRPTENFLAVRQRSRRTKQMVPSPPSRQTRGATVEVLVIAENTTPNAFAAVPVNR